jgi:hypothetical protein
MRVTSTRMTILRGGCCEEAQPDSLNRTAVRLSRASVRRGWRGALHGFTKLFADKYAAQKVRMNNVMPGYCENVPMTEAALRSIPMGRTARFSEIGNVCVFLASEGASYMTRQNVLVDGGVNRAVR